VGGTPWLPAHEKGCRHTNIIDLITALARRMIPPPLWYASPRELHRSKMTPHDRINIDPMICHGELVIGEKLST
jgi:hypothetical protein